MQTERPPVRFAGLQMPVTQELNKNKQAILDCLDWCKDNKVNWLITPEGSLTGYFPNFDLVAEGGVTGIQSAATELVAKAQNLGIGLALGTLWVDVEHRGAIRKNQIRLSKIK